MKNTKITSKQLPKDKTVLTCNNCSDDSYVENLKQCLQFIQTKKSNRLLELYRNQSPQVYKTELKKIQQASRLYHIRICCEGTSHLWRQQYKILMVRQAYQFTRQLHGSQHISADQMIEKAKQYKIYLAPLLDFINEYPTFCKFCTSSKKITKLPYSQKSPIWSLLFNKFNLNFHQYDPSQTVDELLKKLQIAECLDDSCTRDQYDRQNQICLFIITKKCFPPLPKGQGSSPNRSRLKKKAKLMKIKQCQFKTDHLWMKQSQLKVPMQKQARQIAKLLHGQTAHRPKTQIKQIIFKNQTKIYTHGLIPAIDQIVAQCTICHPKSADPIEDRQSNNSQQQKTQDLKLHKKSKIPYARMGLQKKSYWMEQLNSKIELRQKVQRIKQMADSLQIWEDPNDHIQRIVQSTGFYEVAVQLVIDHTHWSRANEQNLQQVLSEVKGIIFKSVKQGRILKAMFACTQTMRNNYYRYGETLSIDYITGVTRKRQASGKQYQVGFFTGQDHTGNLVIFGVSLISKELSSYHLKSLELFYEIMGKQFFPKLICIPDNKPLIMSLQIFKKRKNIQFEYAINWFYVVQFLKKNSGQQLQKNTIIQLFCKAMSEPIPILYRSIMSKIQTQIVNTSNYRQIQKLGEMFCISRLKTNFIGFGLSTERVEQLYRTLERQLVYQLKIGSFLNNLFRMDKYLCEDRCQQQIAQLSNTLNIIGIQNKVLEIHSKYIQKIKQSYQNLQPNTIPQKLQQNLQQIPIYELQQLLKVSSLIHMNIFSQLLHNFYYSLPHHFTLTSNCKYQTEYMIKENKSKNKCVYFCKYFLDDNCWKCNCRVIVLTGLPCSHLIRVILLTKGSLDYYIHSRWFFPSKQEINNHYISSSKLQPKIEDRISDHMSVRSHVSGPNKDNFSVKQNQSDDNASFVSGSVASHKIGLYQGNQRSNQVKSQNQVSKQSVKKSHYSINNPIGQQNNQNNNKKSLTFRQLFFQQFQKTQKQQNQQSNQNDLPLIIQKPQNKKNSPQKPLSQKSQQKSNKNQEVEIIQEESDHFNEGDGEGEERSQQLIFHRGTSLNNLDEFQDSSLKMNCQEGNLYQWDLHKKQKHNQYNIFKKRTYNEWDKRKQIKIKMQDLIAQKDSQQQNMEYSLQKQSRNARQQQMQQQHKQQQYYPQLQQQKQSKIIEQKVQSENQIQEEGLAKSQKQPHSQ